MPLKCKVVFASGKGDLQAAELRPVLLFNAEREWTMLQKLPCSRSTTDVSPRFIILRLREISAARKSTSSGFFHNTCGNMAAGPIVLARIQFSEFILHYSANCILAGRCLHFMT